MKELIIKNINNDFFTLEEKNSNKKLDLIFSFYSDIKPQVEDVLCLDERVLDEKSELFTQPFCYELVGKNKDILEKYLNNNFTEYLILLHGGEKIFFKRIYG